MRIESALTGDVVPRRIMAAANVIPICAGTRQSRGYACLSCCSFLANVYNLVEHCGGLLGQSHVIAWACADCRGYHPLDRASMETIREHVRLYPMSLPLLIDGER